MGEDVVVDGVFGGGGGVVEGEGFGVRGWVHEPVDRVGGRGGGHGEAGGGEEEDEGGGQEEASEAARGRWGGGVRVGWGVVGRVVERC